MKNWLGSCALLGLLMTACGAGQANPASGSAASSVAASPAQAKPASGAAQSAGAGTWDDVLAAAKKEGKVAVFGPDGKDNAEILTQPFQQKYGIPVEYVGDPGPGISPRMLTERQANQFLWDVVVTGTTTGLVALIPGKVLDPLEPALVLPEVTDLKNWRGGQLEFADAGRQFLVMTPFQRGTLFVNPSLVNEKELTSYKDLLDPKWKGKIVMDDPRKAGPGQATFTFFYLHPQLGPDFIKALGSQQITIVKDFQQETDMVGQGRFPILLGGADFAVVARMNQGVPITIVDPRQLKEGSDISPANGAVGLVNRAPHPNAAKAYLNWLLSKDGQTLFAHTNGYVSARADVPVAPVPEWRVPQPGAIKTYDLQAIQLKDKLIPLLAEVFGAS